MKKESISKKIIKNLVIVLSIILAIGFIVKSTYIKTKIRSEQDTNVKNISDIVAPTIAQALWNLDNTSLKILVDSIVKNYNYNYCTIFNEKHETMYEFKNPHFSTKHEKEYSYEIKKDDKKVGEIVIGYNYKNAKETESVFLRLEIGLALLLFIMITLFSFQILKITVITNLLSLKNMLMEISKGEGDLSKRVLIKSDDEIGQTGLAFNSFITKLEEMVRTLKIAVLSLNEVSSQVKESSNSLSENTHQMSASQEEFAASIQSNAKSAKEASEKADHSNEFTNKAKETMINSITAIKQIEISTRQITEFITVITDIADQTNLLALNAAIEAARAGEHGKGFAVVADEVRKLAERSGNSAKQITNIISESANQVNEAVEISKNADEYFTKISNDINHITKELRFIADSNNQQAATVEQTTALMLSNASASEILSEATRKMAEQTESISKLVNKFKISDSKNIF